jgi:hypothetical protein
VAQVVEYLFCKHKALSSNPNPTRKRDRERETEIPKEGSFLSSSFQASEKLHCIYLLAILRFELGALNFFYTIGA